MTTKSQIYADIIDHYHWMKERDARINSIMAVTGMSEIEVNRGIFALNCAWGGDDAIALLDWIYSKVAQGQTTKELMG